MFDTYVSHRNEHSTVSVTEKRAPTDKSVQLLKEMQEAARESVVESMTLPNNAIKAVAHRHDSAIDCTTEFAIFYTLNGQRREVRTEVEGTSTIEQSMKHLYDVLADDLARFLMGNCVAKSVTERGEG